jgi:hypothetical protein
VKLKLFALIFILSVSPLFAQIEHVPVYHPVYDFLIRQEAKGLLPHFSTSELPLQRKKIAKALELIRESRPELSDAENKILSSYLIEFEIEKRENAVVIYSSTDSNQVFSNDFFSDKEKFIYHLKDSKNSISISPLGSLESLFSEDNEVFMGNLGVRLFGSFGEHFGYYLQATNGAILSGERDFALNELHKLQQNVKFADLNSDFDFSESHVIFNYDWFSAIYSRESRLTGSGISQRIFLSTNSPPQDALTMKAEFSNFTYSYSHSELLASEAADINVGFNSDIPSKYLVSHRFALRPGWGEIAFWEGLIYSKRGIDMAYLNPLSFFKSLEHALHDRDNSMMGGGITVRPFNAFQIKGSFLLDDLKFEEIGKNYWSNKTAWNLGLTYILPWNIDLGIEYARVEPYTFTHFDSVNTYTNDEMLIGTNLLPNSDELIIILHYWWGDRYPVTLKASYRRHGANEYDIDGNMTRNVGGSPFHTKMPEDEERVEFLDGNLFTGWNIELAAGWEIVRGFNLKAKYKYSTLYGLNRNVVYISFGFEDF